MAPDQGSRPDPWAARIKRAVTALEELQEAIAGSRNDPAREQEMRAALRLAINTLMTEIERHELEVDKAIWLVSELLETVPEQERSGYWRRLRDYLNFELPIVEGVEVRLGLTNGGEDVR